MEQTFTLRWSWLGLAFSFTERKLVVARQRGARSVHLTLSYANASGEVDLHLKREPAPPGEDRYVSLGRLAPEELARIGEQINRLGERLVQLPMDHWRPVRAGWLSRRAYLILLVPKEIPPEVLRAFIPHKRRGKHQLTFAPLKDPAYARQFADGLYDAKILPYLDPQALQLPLTAASLRKRPALLIAPFTINNRTEWYMIPQNRMTELSARLGAEFALYVGGGLSPEHAKAFDRICDELGLAEIPELADFVSGVRQTLAAPLELAQKAQRKLKGWPEPRSKRPHPKSLMVRAKKLSGGPRAAPVVPA